MPEEGLSSTGHASGAKREGGGDEEDEGGGRRAGRRQAPTAAVRRRLKGKEGKAAPCVDRPKRKNAKGKSNERDRRARSDTNRQRPSAKLRPCVCRRRYP